MRLLDIIDYLVTPNKLNEFYRQQGIPEELIPEELIKDDLALAIYMAGTISLESEIRLFSRQETEGKIHVQKEGIAYVYVLGVDLAVDLLASDLNLQGKEVTNLTRANRVLDYAIYDA